MVKTRAIAASYSNLILPASTFALTPIALLHLGADRMGDALYILAVARLMATLDGGTSGLLIPRLCDEGVKDVGRGLPAPLVRALLAPAGIAVCVAALITVSWRVNRYVVPFAHTSRDATLYLYLAVAVALSLQIGVAFVSSLAATGEFIPLAIINSIGSAGYMLVGTMALPMWPTVEVYLVATIAQFGAISMMSAALILYGRRNNARAAAQLRWVPSLADLNLRMQLISAGSTFSGQLPTVAAGLFLAGTQAAAVGLAQQAGTAIRLVGLSLGTLFVARFSRSAGSARFGDTWRSVERTWLRLVLPAGVICAVTAPLLLRVWVGTEIARRATFAASALALSAAVAVATLVRSSAGRALQSLGAEYRYIRELCAYGLVFQIAVIPWHNVAAVGAAALLSTAVPAWRFLSASGSPSTRAQVDRSRDSFERR